MLRLVRGAGNGAPHLPRAIPQPIRILIVNDYALVRMGLRMFCDKQMDLTIVGEAATCARALAVAARTQPDVIVLDLDLYGENALDHLPALLAVAPQAQALILTSPSHSTLHRQAMHRSAMGLVFKGQTPDVFLQAIRKVHAGEIWVERGLLADVSTKRQPTRSQPRDPEVARIATLTARERDIVALLGEGRNNQDIATRLHLSKTMARHHLRTIFTKLGVVDRLGLVVYAYQHGLVPMPR